MALMTALEALRDRLATIPGVATCKIGLEEGIAPDSYPLIRLVPSKMDRRNMATGQSRAELLIYFGLPVQPFEETPDAGGRVRLEKVYAALLELEDAVIDQLAIAGGVYLETITDEDRLETYKLFAVRCEVEG